MLNVKKALTKVLTRLSNAEQQVELGWTATTGNFTLSEDIDNFTFLLVEMWDNGSANACHGCNFSTPSIIKLFNTSAKGFGVSGYGPSNSRIYAYVSYVDDTTMYAQVPAGYGLTVYGLMRK